MGISEKDFREHAEKVAKLEARIKSVEKNQEDVVKWTTLRRIYMAVIAVVMFFTTILGYIWHNWLKDLFFATPPAKSAFQNLLEKVGDYFG